MTLVAALWLPAVVAAAAVEEPPANQQSVHLELYQPTAGNTVTLRGTAPDFSTDLRLVARGGNATLHTVTFPLASDGPSEPRIEPSAVVVEPSERVLTKDLPETFTLKVTGIESAGTYRGKLHLQPKENPAAILELQLEILATAATIDFEPAEVLVPVEVGGQAASRGITLRSRAGVTGFGFLAHDLIKRDDETVWIDRGQIKLLNPDQDRKLGANEAKNFSIEVPPVAEAGDYVGRVEIRPAGTAEIIRIPLRVKATQEAAFTTLEDPLKLIRARSPFPLFPAGWVQNSFGIYLEQTNEAPARLRSLTARLRGEHGGFELGPDEVHLIAQRRAGDPCGISVTKPAGDSSDGARTSRCVPVRLELSRIPPDRYVGAVHLEYTGARQAVKQTIDLSVRRGPLWALLCILAGVLLAPVVRYYQSTGVKQNRLLRSLDRITDWLESLQRQDRQRVENQVRRWIEGIRRLTVERDVDAADAALTTLRARTDLFDDLFAFEATVDKLLAQSPGDPKLTAAKNKLGEALTDVLREDDESAKQRIEEARKLVSEAPRPVVMAISGPDSLGATAARLAQDAVSASKAQARQGRLVSKIGRRLSVNSDALVAESQVWVGALVHVLMVLGLCAVGFIQLYLGNDTFGARPVLDYATAFLWGFGSDLATKKIGDLGAILKQS